jgi:hypothetical protein
MSESEVPHVEKELIFSKTIKMVCVIGIIILLLVLYVYYYDKTQTKLIKKPNIINALSLSYILPKSQFNRPILGDHIVLYNLTNIIPINRIMVITTDRNIISLEASDAEIKYPRGGMSLKFRLPSSLLISQIIVETDVNNTFSPNITKTQVEIMKNNNVVWSYNNTLFLEKYNYVHVYQPHLKSIRENSFYPDKAEDFKYLNLSVNEEERILTTKLMDNTWYT